MDDLLKEGSMSYFGSRDEDRTWYEGVSGEQITAHAAPIDDWKEFVRFPTRAQNLPIWSWKHDPETPNKVTDIRCRTRGMKFMDMSVAKEITWDDPKVQYAGKDYTLPLTPEHLIRTCQIAKGRVPDSDKGLWRLEAKLDQSLLLVFGYVLAKGELRPMRPDWTAPGIMTPPYTPSMYRPIHVFESEDATEFVATVNDSFRVLVLMELVCCKERDDFEPLGAASMARLYPMMNIVASDELEHVEATIHVHRNRQGGCGHMPGAEHMSPDIRAGLWADTNSRRAVMPGGAPPLPLWDNIFDYYDLEPTRTATKVVIRGYTERTLADAIEALEIHSPSPGALRDYVKHDVRKVQRQGSWDNIHLAPKMRVDPQSANFNVAMAPICAHDCLHTHWRWGDMWEGSMFEQKSLWGWDAQGPNRKPGAPMVPFGQTVTIALEETTDVIGYRYSALAQGNQERRMSPGHWQTINHHGCAYAVSMHASFLSSVLRDVAAAFGAAAANVSVLEFPPGPTLDAIPGMVWAAFYSLLQRSPFPPGKSPFDRTPPVEEGAMRLRFPKGLDYLKET